ncbi:MAG TPA: hypothetical protein ENF20_02705 [Candidatus Marinimicrobia bacterium]|nr:hypothetical protein [Candidatus Neomarinimicrobiota bacterium]
MTISDIILIDTTVQEKNIEKCRDIAKQESVILRQSYKRTLKRLMIDQRFREHPKRRKRANAAARRIKTETIVLCRYVHGTFVHYPNIKIWSQENQWVFQT